MFVRNQLLFSPDEGEAQTGGGGETAPETQETTPQEFNITTASKFIKNAGGRVFLSDKAWDDAVKANLGAWEVGVRKGIKEKTGVDWTDGETLDSYSMRAVKESSKPESKGKDEDPEFKALQSALKAKNDELEQYKTKLTSFEQQQINLEKESLVNKGFPVDKLDYDDFTKEGILLKINNSIENTFEFSKDDKGWKATNKQTGEPVLDSEGNRKPIDKVVSDYISNLQGLKFKQNGKDQTLPGDTSGAMSESAKKSAIAKAEAEILNKGLFPHERGAVEIYKKYNAASEKQLAFLNSKK